MAILPGDRWRRSHDLLKDQIYVDGRHLGVNAQKGICGLFTLYHSPEGQQAYENLSRRLRSQQLLEGTAVMLQYTIKYVYVFPK